MPTKKPRIYVTFNPIDFEHLRRIAILERLSMSECARKMIEEWIERFRHLSEIEMEEFLDRLRRKSHGITD